MTTMFSFIFFLDGNNYYCLVRPIMVNNKKEYHVTVKYVDYGLPLQEDYLIQEENGRVPEETLIGLESPIKKNTIRALQEHLNRRKLAGGVDH